MSLSYEPVSKKPPEPGQNRPRSFGTITIPGTPVGAIVSVGLVVISWFSLPLSRPFIVDTGAPGLIFPLPLYCTHRRSPELNPPNHPKTNHTPPSPPPPPTCPPTPP